MTHQNSFHHYSDRRHALGFVLSKGIIPQINGLRRVGIHTKIQPQSICKNTERGPHFVSSSPVYTYRTLWTNIGTSDIFPAVGYGWTGGIRVGSLQHHPEDVASHI
jgi:hypothetical protein